MLRFGCDMVFKTGFLAKPAKDHACQPAFSIHVVYNRGQLLRAVRKQLYKNR